MKLLRDKECEEEGGRMSVRERTSPGTRESNHSEKKSDSVETTKDGEAERQCPFKVNSSGM